jgi:hypothetical protein
LGIIPLVIDMLQTRLPTSLWLTLGLLIGGLAGGARSASGPAYRYSTARTLAQDLFERGITAGPQASFRLTDLVVHSPEDDGVYWVTGTYHESGGIRGPHVGPFKFRAPTPYPATRAVSVSGPLTVRTYLDALAPRVPQADLRYRYAWDELPAPGVALWAAYGLAAGACLAAVSRLVQGPRPVREKTAALPPAPPIAPVPSQVVQSEPMLLSSGPDDIARLDVPTAQAASPASPRPLVCEPVPTPASSPSPSKHYRGEFYPTEAHAAPEAP